MKKDKYPQSEKLFCIEEAKIIDDHTSVCSICKTSREEYTKFGISITPPCSVFFEQMRIHVNNCKVCNPAEKKWNEDALPISKEQREIVKDLKLGKLPDIGKLKNVASILFKDLQMSSDEIKEAQEKAEDIAKKLKDSDQ